MIITRPCPPSKPLPPACRGASLQVKKSHADYAGALVGNPRDRRGRDAAPYLSTYMGHATVESTYYYIHTSPDFMRAYVDITAEGGSPLPEVGFE